MDVAATAFVHDGGGSGVKSTASCILTMGCGVGRCVLGRLGVMCGAGGLDVGLCDLRSPAPHREQNQNQAKTGTPPRSRQPL